MTGIAVDAAGYVYVVDQDSDTQQQRIQKFDSSGNFITKWGSYGDGNGQFNGARRIAVDTAGNVYVGDNSKDAIFKFAPGDAPATTTSTTTVPANTTTTSVSGGECPAESLLGDDARSLGLFRSLRDTVLASTPEGKRYTALYYIHAAELTDIFGADRQLKSFALQFIYEIIPGIETLAVQGKVVVGEKLVQDGLRLLDALSAQASPSLKKDLQKLAQEIETGVLFKALGIEALRN